MTNGHFMMTAWKAKPSKASNARVVEPNERQLRILDLYATGTYTQKGLGEYLGVDTSVIHYALFRYGGEWSFWHYGRVIHIKRPSSRSSVDSGEGATSTHFKKLCCVGDCNRPPMEGVRHCEQHAFKNPIGASAPLSRMMAGR